LIKFSEDALDYIRGKNSPVFIDLSYKVGCCVAVDEAPVVRFGVPADLSGYTRQDAQDVTLYIPSGLPDPDSLTIDTQNFLGFRSLVIDGWKLI